MVNRRRTKITPKCSSLLHLYKKVEKDKSHQIIRDHYHFTVEYRDVAHNICNLKFNMSNEIPVIFHSGSQYDHHQQIISG